MFRFGKEQPAFDQDTAKHEQGGNNYDGRRQRRRPQTVAEPDVRPEPGSWGEGVNIYLRESTLVPASGQSPAGTRRVSRHPA